MKKTYKVVIRFGGHTDAEFNIHATDKKKALKMAEKREWADSNEDIEELGTYKEHEFKKVMSIKEIKDG